MAPMAPVGKKRVLELLAERGPPLRFGSPHPCTAIVQQDGVFRLRDLVVDESDSKAAFEEARKTGRPFMPENHYALARPTGKIHLEAKTLDALREKIEAFSWPKHW